MLKYKPMSAVILAICLLLSSAPAAVAAESAEPLFSLNEIISETATYLVNTLENTQAVGPGCEWALVGIARSGCTVQQNLYDEYYYALERGLIESQGVLQENKYTEYSRVILSLTALGEDPTDVGGYNLLKKLSDFDQVVRQGINGPIFALIAFDSGNYEIPACEGIQKQTTRELLLAYILSRQLSDGGFALGGVSGDPDITAMALQALSAYRERSEIATAIDRALAFLSASQTDSGGYESYGVNNAESPAQVICALTCLGIDPETDSRFVKEGGGLFSALLSFYREGGGFFHKSSDSEVSAMASEQGLCALVAYQRFLTGRNNFFNMQDVSTAGSTGSGTSGLPDKNPDVSASPILWAGKSFQDIIGHPDEAKVNDLACRGIVNGVSDIVFAPDRSVTRAEFAAIVVRALNLPLGKDLPFGDIADGSWYSDYVSAAFSYGIVTGKAETVFAPLDLISRQEAAVMLARAAALCGRTVTFSSDETRDLLAQFEDYTDSAMWSRAGLACLHQVYYLTAAGAFPSPA